MIFKKALFGLLMVISANQFLFAQIPDNFQPTLSHPLKFGNERKLLTPRVYDGIPDTFKVVGILVQFQEDNSGLTTGNGLFDLSNKYFNPATQKDTVIDAPPYDSAYFVDHLKFLKNYYEKSSKGKLNIDYELFGRIINLPKPMMDYSPQSGQNNAKLGDLFTDAWTSADSFINFSGYDPNKTAFVIFHAGVGRDVNLSAILGFDPTPFDIPSVYLGLKNLREFYGNSYNGFNTGDGFSIQNSLIIPSTELRELNLISGKTLLELGMNGILTASFGSYLGLPDLFNTKDGKTAIGRFGLMDGQGIFSYNGLFPPEPCAWSKVFLGWINPIVISSGSQNITVNTSSVPVPNDSTMFKVLISSKEYYLIENKNRNPDGTGQTVYTRNRAFNDSSVFTKDQSDFVSFNISAISGNVTDVKTLDWSLPGLIVDTADYKGGIVIWHIDENVIDANISSNTINNNLMHRGVSLVEAKGAQTIGVTFTSPFGKVTGDGTIFDYWYDGKHGVPSTIYKNEFTPTSIPNTLSYSFANNNIFFTAFSPTASVMTFNLSIGNSTISPLVNFPKLLSIDTSGNAQVNVFDFVSEPGEEIFVNSLGKTYGFKINGNGIITDSNFVISNDHGKYIPGSLYRQTTGQPQIVTVSDQSIQYIDNSGTAITSPFDAGRVPSAPFLVNDTLNGVVLGFQNGLVGEYFFETLFFKKIDSLNNAVRQFTRTSDTNTAYISTANKYIVVGNIKSASSTDTLIVNNSDELLINGVKVNINYDLSSIQQSPVLADLSKDGKQEIVIVANSSVYALTSDGVVLDNFPVNFNNRVTSGVSVADVDADGNFDLIFATANGNLYVYGTNGKTLNGFPVLIGPNTISTPAIANLNDTTGIVIYSGDGYVYAFKTQYVYNENNVLWKNYLKDKYLSNNNFRSVNSPPVFSGKLPDSRVYNWPNPVYDNKTYIRYYINGTAGTVSVKILDLSGEMVTSLNATSFSNTDNEVIWDVSDVQSGIYYGVIEATVDGSAETKIIKIAVVK